MRVLRDVIFNMKLVNILATWAVRAEGQGAMNANYMPVVVL